MIVINLVVVLVEQGWWVLLIDFDFQGNVLIGLGIDFEDCDIIIYDIFVGEELLFDVVREILLKGLMVILVMIDLSFVDIELIFNEKRSFLFYDVLCQLVMDVFVLDYVLIDCLFSLNFLMINVFVVLNFVVVFLQSEFFVFEGLF